MNSITSDSHRFGCHRGTQSKKAVLELRTAFFVKTWKAETYFLMYFIGLSSAGAMTGAGAWTIAD